MLKATCASEDSQEAPGFSGGFLVAHPETCCMTNKATPAHTRRKTSYAPSHTSLEGSTSGRDRREDHHEIYNPDCYTLVPILSAS